MISDEAVKAMYAALPGWVSNYLDPETMRTALETAAPHMLAEAQDEAPTVPGGAVEAAWAAFYAEREDMGAALEAATPHLLGGVRAELAYQTARAEYFRYAPEIKHDPECVKRLADEMHKLRPSN